MRMDNRTSLYYIIENDDIDSFGMKLETEELINDKVGGCLLAEYDIGTDSILVSVLIVDKATGEDIKLDLVDYYVADTIGGLMEIEQELLINFVDTGDFDKAIIKRFEEVDKSRATDDVKLREKEMYKEFVQLVHKFIVSRGNADLF